MHTDWESMMAPILNRPAARVRVMTHRFMFLMDRNARASKDVPTYLVPNGDGRPVVACNGNGGARALGFVLQSGVNMSMLVSVARRSVARHEVNLLNFEATEPLATDDAT